MQDRSTSRRCGCQSHRPRGCFDPAAGFRYARAALAAGAKVILLTPTHDEPALYPSGDVDASLLPLHAEAIRRLAPEEGVGLADSYAAFDRATRGGTDLANLLSWVNHPNQRGHELVVQELMRWFPPLIDG